MGRCRYEGQRLTFGGPLSPPIIVSKDQTPVVRVRQQAFCPQSHPTTAITLFAHWFLLGEVLLLSEKGVVVVASEVSSFSWYLALLHGGSWLGAGVLFLTCYMTATPLMLRKHTWFRETSPCFGNVPSSGPHTEEPRTYCTNHLSASSCCLFFIPCQTLLQLVNIFHSSTGCQSIPQGPLPRFSVKMSFQPHVV